MKTTDQIAAEAAAKIHSALLHNVTDEQVEFIQAIIKAAIEEATKAYADRESKRDIMSKMTIARVEELERRAAHASEQP